MLDDILERTAQLREAEQPFVLATVVAYKSPQSARPGSKAVITADGRIDGWIGGGCVQPIVAREALKAIETGKPRLISISPDSLRHDWKGVESYDMTCQGGGSLEIYLEPVLPRQELFVIGNSPIAQILACLGKLLEFKVSVADPEATAERFPEADHVLKNLEGLAGRIRPASFVVVATMGTGDEEGLESVMGIEAVYLGLVASKEKAKGLFQYLRDKGVPDEFLNRVKCPAGLDLGGETLAEIALSVMAEITSVRRDIAKQSADERVKTTQSGVASGASSDAVDPVCGMTVDMARARYTTTVGDVTIYFCCLRCKETFDRTPEQYLVQRV